jgi:hypothetical protein
MPLCTTRTVALININPYYPSILSFIMRLYPALLNVLHSSVVIKESFMIHKNIKSINVTVDSTEHR